MHSLDTVRQSGGSQGFVPTHRSLRIQAVRSLQGLVSLVYSKIAFCHLSAGDGCFEKNAFMVLDEGGKPCITLDIEDKYFLVGVFLWIRVFNDVENVAMGEVVEDCLKIDASL